jgi:hypothetical protein
MAGKEKSSPDKSDELLNMLSKYFEALDLTYLSRICGMELAPFPHCVRRTVFMSS